MTDALHIGDAALQEKIAFINTMTELHLGSVELASVSDGVVTVKFQGLCTACHLRPVTLNALIRPALSSVPGVQRVEAIGVRVSPQAEQRMAALREDKSTIGAQYDRLIEGFRRTEA